LPLYESETVITRYCNNAEGDPTPEKVSLKTDKGLGTDAQPLISHFK
jgi:hypothetical protein